MKQLGILNTQLEGQRMLLLIQLSYWDFISASTHTHTQEHIHMYTRGYTQTLCRSTQSRKYTEMTEWNQKLGDGIKKTISGHCRKVIF